jgi:hypothetical protein
MHTKDISAEGSSTELAATVENNWMALAAHLTLTSGGELRDFGPLFRFATRLPSGFLNGVLRAQLHSSEIASTIKETLSFFQSLRTPWRWVVGPSSLPTDLGDELMQMGFRLTRTMPGMTIDLQSLAAPATAPGLLIKEVTDPAGLEGWLHVRKMNQDLDEDTTNGWRLAHLRCGLSPELPLRHFVGWFNGAPVAASSLFLGAGVAGIYHVDTLVQVRNRGFGSALTLTALQAARARGWHVAVLAATILGESIYRSLGFREVGQLHEYVPMNGEGSGIYGHAA